MIPPPPPVTHSMAETELQSIRAVEFTEDGRAAETMEATSSEQPVGKRRSSYNTAMAEEVAAGTKTVKDVRKSLKISNVVDQSNR